VLARIRKSLDEREEGFTLIELLVVMIIIGILAAIAIPVFLSQKNKAKDTSAKADVSVIGKDMAAYYVDGTGALTVTGGPGGLFTIKQGATPVDSGNLSSGNSVVSSKGTGDSDWCVSVKNSAAGTTEWHYGAVGGLATGTCP
jgi:prepilin-type N-terminal cleavage/methylation domain-containing protein